MLKIHQKLYTEGKNECENMLSTSLNFEYKIFCYFFFTEIAFDILPFGYVF